MLANKSVAFRDQFKHANSMNEEMIIAQVPAESFKQFLRLIYIYISCGEYRDMFFDYEIRDIINLFLNVTRKQINR